MILQRNPAASIRGDAYSHVVGELKLSACTHKSYIRQLIDKKWKHVITLTEDQTADHHELMENVSVRSEEPRR